MIRDGSTLLDTICHAVLGGVSGFSLLLTAGAIKPSAATPDRLRKPLLSKVALPAQRGMTEGAEAAHGGMNSPSALRYLCLLRARLGIQREKQYFAWREATTLQNATDIRPPCTLK